MLAVMSNYLSVAVVTAAFAKLLTDAVQAVPNLSSPPECRVGLPPFDSTGFVGANLLLYRVTPDAARRNDNLPTRPGGGVRPQTAIELDYIVSFYGDDLRFEPHRLIGAVIAHMQAHPVLTALDIRAAIESGSPDGPLAGADLDQQPELVRLAPNPLDLDGLQDVWSLTSGVPFAPSLAYTASAILIDAATSEPVRRTPGQQTELNG
jgi:uncharacterized protein DUF4255